MAFFRRIPSRSSVPCRIGGRGAASLVVLVCALAVLALSSCSNDQSGGVEDSSDAPTVSEPAMGGGAATTAYSGPNETTFPQGEVAGPDPYRMILRLEGSEGTRFTGDCSFGPQSMQMEGGVPDSVVIDTGGSSLDCRIQKSGDGSGELRVVLTSDGRTRSVQQAGADRRELSVSYNPSAQSG